MNIGRLLLLSIVLSAGFGQAQASPSGSGKQPVCQASLNSTSAGAIHVETGGLFEGPNHNPTIWWEPPASGSAVYMGMSYVDRHPGDNGPPDGGHIRFPLPGKVKGSALTVDIATPNGERRTFGGDKIRYGEERGVASGYVEFGMDDPSTAPLVMAMHRAPYATVTVSAGGARRLETRFLIGQAIAARDALIAKAMALVEAKSPGACLAP